jgi:hypothetical protein
VLFCVAVAAVAYGTVVSSTKQATGKPIRLGCLGDTVGRVYICICSSAEPHSSSLTAYDVILGGLYSSSSSGLKCYGQLGWEDRCGQ